MPEPVLINGTITGFESRSAAAQIEPEAPAVESVHEKIKRPAMTEGRTYKLRAGESSVYATINNIRLNVGTEHEEVRPFELFLNSKGNDCVQWVSALTLMVSAVWRKGGDYAFVAEELRAIGDPHPDRSGFGRSIDGTSRFVPSLASEIGACIAIHIRETCGRVADGASAAPVAAPAAKASANGSAHGAAPIGQKDCGKCGGYRTVVREAGCESCKSCGDSRCG